MEYEGTLGCIEAIKQGDEVNEGYLVLGSTGGTVQVWEADSSDKMGLIMWSWEEDL